MIKQRKTNTPGDASLRGVRANPEGAQNDVHIYRRLVCGKRAGLVEHLGPLLSGVASVRFAKDSFTSRHRFTRRNKNQRASGTVQGSNDVVQERISRPRRNARARTIRSHQNGVPLLLTPWYGPSQGASGMKGRARGIAGGHHIDGSLRRAAVTRGGSAQD